MAIKKWEKKKLFLFLNFFSTKKKDNKDKKNTKPSINIFTIKLLKLNSNILTKDIKG